MPLESIKSSGAFTTDSTGELHILGHDGNSLGVDGAEVGVLEETDHVGFGGLLEGENGGGLETELVSVLRGDFTEGDGAGSETVGFLDTVGGLLGLLSSGLVGDVLAGVLGAGVFAGGLFGAGHCYFLII